MYALPLQVGAIKVGVLDLYRDAEEPLSSADFSDAVEIAELVTATLGPWWDQPLSTREVHQATGMIIAQLGVDAGEAYVRLQAYAFAHRHLIREVAYDVVERRL